MARFLDTNILIRLFTADDPTKAQACRALMERVERGEETVVISLMVVFETVFTLQRGYGLSRQAVRDLVLPLIQLRHVRLPQKGLVTRAFELYVDHNLSFADAYNVAFMERRGLGELYSYDADFDRVPTARRVEPAGP